MKKCSIIVALCAAVFFRQSSSAVAVPQNSITNYYFSLPYSTNIAGVVIGEPPAYRVLRREDIAWIREAACERAALAQGTWWNGAPRWRLVSEIGRWPLSESNRFSTITTGSEWINGHLETNIVVGRSLVTNASVYSYGADIANPYSGQIGIDAFSGLSFGSGHTRYLVAPTNGFNESKSGPYYLPSHTNIVTSVVTNWGSYWGDDGLVQNKTTVVEYVTMAMTNGTSSVHTNTWSYDLPYEVRNVQTNISEGSVYDLLFPDGSAKWLDDDAPGPMRIFPLYSYVTNSYGILRKMNVLADEVYNTNIFQNIVHRWRYYVSDETWRPYDTRTNQTSAVGLFVNGVAVDVINEGYDSGNGRLVFPTRFDWDVVNTGGVCRLSSKADLFAHVTASAEVYVESWTNYTGRFIKHLGKASMIESPKTGKVCFEATVNGPAIAREGASACGCPVSSSWIGWEDSVVRYTVSFVLVYDLLPWASLPGWNQ